MKIKGKVRLNPRAKPTAKGTAKTKSKARTPAKAGSPKAHVAAKPMATGNVTSFVADKQQELYEEAIRLFYAQKYDRAAALFQKAMQGENRTLAHHAQVHASICARRQRQPQVQLRTAEDHYNYAVTLLNARRLEEAVKHLETALRMAPHADHLHYALAAAQALAGNREGAYQRLRTAIELEPQNRARARADGDFAGVLEYHPLAVLLHLDRRVE
jgi:tetratricopeptide (TPR) repeat protein